MGFIARHAARLAFLASAVLSAGSVVAQQMGPMMTGAHAADFDWVAHTRHTLTELKSKLNLDAGQTIAWNAWSHGVLDDADRQADLQREPQRDSERDSERDAQRDAQRDPKRADHTDQYAGNSWVDAPTPQRMALGIDHLREHIAAMQEHLVQLQAAQQRTSRFYDVLDTNQRTIFDLYWREVHHRAAANDTWGMPMTDGRAMRSSAVGTDGGMGYDSAGHGAMAPIGAPHEAFGTGRSMPAGQ